MDAPAEVFCKLCEEPHPVRDVINQFLLVTRCPKIPGAEVVHIIPPRVVLDA